MPYARLLAEKLRPDVALIHVIDSEITAPSSSAGQSRYQDVIRAEHDKSMGYLKKIAASFAASMKVECIVEQGNPAEVIVDKAAVNTSALIAMTTHGRAGLNRWLLGSVADKVLHAAANPLLLVRAGEKAKTQGAAMWKRILVPLDGSALAETVIPHAAEFAQKMAAVATAGFAAEKIIDLARQSSDSLVAMSTHGRSGVNRWVMGSVTDRVVRHAGDPVLTVRAMSTPS